MEVMSCLGMDSNVVVVGETIELIVSTSSEQEEDVPSLGEDQKCCEETISVTAVSSPTSAVVKVGKPGEATAESKCLPNMDKLTHRSRVNFLVSFQAEEAAEYSLEVRLHKEHVPGSPFSIVALTTQPEEEEKEESESERLSVPAGEPVTFVLPMSWRGGAVSPTVVVGGPHGPCEVLNKTGNNSLSFFPNQPGNYFVSLISEKGSVEEKLHIRARSGDMGASKCNIFESDKSLFQKPIRFSDGCKISFRVNTLFAYGMGQLRVVTRGPSEASVTVNESISGEEERITFQPSTPGRYSLDILWGGHHIGDSPFSLYFKKPRSPVECKGLDLSKEVLVMGVLFRFKLSCNEAEKGDIEMYCVPPSAASLKVTAAESPDIYLCEVIPRELGTHQVSIQMKGTHLSGSPYLVNFRSRGNPELCRVEGEVESVQNGPRVRIYVDTAGAGEGKLTAVAIEEVTKERMVAPVTRLDGGRHLVEFTPGRGLECKLGVLYDGQHIPGSPFPLLFPGSASFSVKGDGVIRATVNRWSSFSIHSVNAGPGALSVSIEGPGDINIIPTITPKGGTHFDVSYLPNTEGEYLIFARWGEHQIPGSPFTVQCFSEESLSHYTIWRPSNRIPHGNPIEFTVEDGRTEREKLRDKSPLCVEARCQSPKDILTASTSRDNDGNVYCQFDPPHPGNYTINVSCRGLELAGSPFKVTVPSPPRAERVRVWGEGLLDHRLPSFGGASRFSVDTTDAGSGVLGIKVRL